MADLLHELMEVLASVGATMTLYGRPITEDQLRDYANSLVDDLYLNTRRNCLSMTTKRQLSHIEIDHIARAAHEVNRAYAMALGDFTHKPWDNAPDWQKSSARAGVIGIASSEYTPEQSHEAWCTLKLSQGWTRGDHKDEFAKTHPCLLPYAELPEEQRYKDVLYTTVVKAMLDGLWRIPQ